MPSKLAIITVATLHTFVACLAFYDAQFSEPPAPQVVLPCYVVRVIDGDTVVVRVQFQFNVRLLDCWAPEKHTTSIDGEKARGLASAEALRAIAEGKPGFVAVPMPSDPSDSLASVFTLGRVLGHVHVGGSNIAELQRKAGHAYATKAELIDALARAPPAK